MESMNRRLNSFFNNIVFVRCWILVDHPFGYLFKGLCDDIDELGLGRQLEEALEWE